MTDQVTERALKIAKDRFGWNQVRFAREIEVEKQHITNWLARGMPARQHAKVAAKLAITIEELLTGKYAETRGDRVAASKVAEPRVASWFGVQLTEEAVLFAAEWAKLRSPLKAQIQAMVETLVGEQVRAVRKKSVSDEGLRG